MPFLTCILTVLLRRKSCIFFEYLGKIALILKACGQSNINNRIIRIRQETLAFLDSYHVQVFLEGGTGSLLKQGRKISRV